MDSVPRGEHDVPLTTPQDAFCDLCQTSHVARITPNTTPSAVKNRLAIQCPILGYVARFELKSHRLEVLPGFLGRVHLSEPLIHAPPRDFRPYPRYRPHHRQGGYHIGGFHVPAAAPAPPQVAVPVIRNIKISLEQTNHHVTRSVNYAVSLTAFRLSAVPDHVLRQIEYDKVEPSTVEILLGNQWREFEHHVDTDISEVRGQDILHLRAVSKVFPLTYARDMASGLRAYSTTCSYLPNMPISDVFEAAFLRTPWQSEPFFEALEHWVSLEPDMQDYFCNVDRSDDFTWTRVVGAADHARLAAASAKRASASTSHRQKRTRGSSSEPEIIPNPLPRAPKVKREPRASLPPPRKKKRLSTTRFVPVDGDDSDVLIEEVIDVDSL